MKFTAKQIADFLNGKVEGDPKISVSDISKIEEGKDGTLSFLANPKYSKYLYTTDASIVLLNEDFELEKNVACTLIRVKDAYQAFASLLELYDNNKPKNVGISKYAIIDDTAEVGKNVYIGPFVYIGKNVRISDNVKIFPHSYISHNVEIKENTILAAGVKVYSDCIIGKECIVHAGVVIGSDGFGFAPKSQKDYKKIPQVGNVIIEDKVEIGSNTTIDRATIGSTIIRTGVKLDNLIQVAHNVEIGANTVIAAQTGISGSTRIGEECMIGGQVGIVGHLNIADNVKIGAQSGISSNIKEKGIIILGSPAQDIKESRRSIAIYRRLPDLDKKVNALEKELEALKKLLKENKK